MSTGIYGIEDRLSLLLDFLFIPKLAGIVQNQEVLPHGLFGGFRVGGDHEHETYRITI